MRRVRVFLLAALCALPLRAHQTAVSYSELFVHGRSIDGTLRFSMTDLRSLMRIEPPDLPVPALTHLLLDSFAIRGCTLGPGATAQMDGEDGIVLQAHWDCKEPVEEVQARAGFLDALPIGHTHLSRISFGSGEVSQRIAQVDDPSFEARRVRSVGQEFRRFLLLGIEHIFTGYDHIAFLIGLLLLGGSVGELIKIVTAFTVAHSVTLALAALSILSPPSRVIEPLIAASIVFVGAENLWALRRGAATDALRHRWALTFAFGLVHGFGFASVLRELELPRAVLLTGLVSFNLGVEVGQVCIVLAALPLLRSLRRWPVFAPSASTIVAALGAFWLAQRLSGCL